MAEEYKPWELYKTDDGYQFSDPSGSWQTIRQEPGSQPISVDEIKKARDFAKSQWGKGGGVAIRKEQPAPPFTSSQAEQASKALPGIVQQQGAAKSLTPPPSGTPETLGALQVAPKTVHDATVDVLKKDLGMGKVADVLGAAVPSSWSEVAALTSMLLPLPARMAGSALGRLIMPTVAGGTAGTISGEGGLAGATTGLLTGVGGEVGRGVNRAVTSVGKTTFNLGQEMLLKFNEKFGPGTGKAIMDSIPSLQAAGINVKNANDMRRLVTQDAGISKVGQLFDDIEKRIVKTVKDRIQMPVDERVAMGTSIGRRQGSTTSAGFAESSGTSSTTARRAGQSRGQIASDVTTTTTPLSERGEIPIVRNVITEGTRGPAISSSVSASEGGRAGSTMSSADRFTRGQTEASTRSSRITTKQPGHVPMTPENARAYIKELRDSGSPLYGKAQEAFKQAVEKADPALAKQYEQVVNDYSSIKAFQSVFGKPENIDLIFPYLGKRGHGFDIGHFAQILNSEAVRLGSDVGRFAPVYKYLGGGSPVEGAGPALMESKPWRAWLRIPGTPVGVPLTTAPSAGQAAKKSLKVELTPELAAALQKHPALGELLRGSGLDRAAGGYVAGRIGSKLVDEVNQ